MQILTEVNYYFKDVRKVKMIKINLVKWFLLLVCLSLVLPVISCSANQVDQEYIDFSARASEDYLIAVNNRDFNSFSKIFIAVSPIFLFFG